MFRGEILDDVEPLRKLAHAIYRDFLTVGIETFHLIFFLIFAQNIDCGYTLEPPNEYP